MRLQNIRNQVRLRDFEPGARLWYTGGPDINIGGGFLSFFLILDVLVGDEDPDGPWPPRRAKSEQ